MSEEDNRRGARQKKMSGEPTGCDWLTRILVPRLGPRKHIRLILVDSSTANGPTLPGSREVEARGAGTCFPDRQNRDDGSDLIDPALIFSKNDGMGNQARTTGRQAMNPAETPSTTNISH